MGWTWVFDLADVTDLVLSLHKAISHHMKHWLVGISDMIIWIMIVKATSMYDPSPISREKNKIWRFPKMEEPPNHPFK